MGCQGSAGTEVVRQFMKRKTAPALAGAVFGNRGYYQTVQSGLFELIQPGLRSAFRTTAPGESEPDRIRSLSPRA